MTHQVGVSETEVDDSKQETERKASLKGKVSFDQPEATTAALDQQDSFAGVTRVSFEKPADLFINEEKPAAEAETAKADAAPAPAEVKPEASNTGTAKRKSKKKRDEVCRHFETS